MSVLESKDKGGGSCLGSGFPPQHCSRLEGKPAPPQAPACTDRLTSSGFGTGLWGTREPELGALLCQR